MRLAALTLGLLSCLAIGKEGGSEGIVSAVLRVEPGAHAGRFHWVLVDLPPAVNGARTLHCHGRSLKELAKAEAQRNDKGLDEWRTRLDIGPGTAGRKDSLALCAGVEGGGLKYLWSAEIVTAQGFQLSGVDCWVGNSLELECSATRPSARTAPRP